MEICSSAPVFANHVVALSPPLHLGRSTMPRTRQSSLQPPCLSVWRKRAKNFPCSAEGRTQTLRPQAILDNSERLLEQKPILVIDNYDSFTYNLCQYLGNLGCEFKVFRNDEITIDEIKRKDPPGILISPGPGTPQDSGISLEVVRKLGPSVPIFGVCMGLQCIGEAFGGRIVRSPHGVVHGKTSKVYYDKDDVNGLFSGLPQPFLAARYHSLVIDRETFPADELKITSWTEDGLIMGARHKKYPHIQGVQFHPESVITEQGVKIVRNFITSLETINLSEDCKVLDKRT